MFSNIQSSQEDNRFVFTSSSVGTGNKRVAWNKPPGIIGLNILCIGGGGSGGSGYTFNDASVKHGGGGGSSGTITSVSILSRFLPETLYITVGRGGARNTVGVSLNGNNGTNTIVSIAEDTTTDYYNVAIAFGGNFGEGYGSGQSGGAAVTAPTITNMPIASCGIYSMIGGKGGETGGTGTGARSPLYTLQGSILSGGQGGGSAASGIGSSTLYAPGGVMVNQNINDSIRLPVISSSQDLADGNGTTLFKPIFCSFGGDGGWSSDTGASYDAGNGGIGCGGGGSGSSLIPYAYGQSGAGGDGLVIISCW